MTFLLNNPEETVLLGGILANAMLSSPVRCLYLRAPLGGGKTTLTRGFAAAMPGGEFAEVASPSFTLCNEYPTNPRIIHADLYRLPEGSMLPEEIEDAMEDEAFLVLEWPEHLRESAMHSVRLELCLEPCSRSGSKYLDKENKTCETVRAAALCAYGKTAEELLNKLWPELFLRFG